MRQTSVIEGNKNLNDYVLGTSGFTSSGKQTLKKKGLGLYLLFLPSLLISIVYLMLIKWEAEY